VTDFVSPTSLAQAVDVLGKSPEMQPIAGCTDVLVCDLLERSALAPVLDLSRIPELKGIHRLSEGVEIGAMTTFSELRRSEVIRDLYPALAAAAAVIGGWQIQNRATLGGNIVNASPAGDSLPVLLALNATVVTVGTGGEREVPLDSFYSGYRQTTLRAGELVARVRLPMPAAGSRQFFRKVGTREAQAISKIVVALVARLEEKMIAEYRLAAGSVAATPVRLVTVEEAVIGQAADTQLAERAGDLAGRSVEPIDDVRSTAAYRRFALDRVVRRLTLELVMKRS